MARAQTVPAHLMEVIASVAGAGCEVEVDRFIYQLVCAFVISKHACAPVERLRSAIIAVLNEETYRAAARRLQIAMQQIDGLEQASNIIERELKIGLPTGAQSR